MIKDLSSYYFFFDLDGTLINHKTGKLEPSAIKSINKLKESNANIVIATGRAPFDFEKERKELDIENFISINGNYIVKDNKVISSTPLGRDFMANKVVPKLNEEGYLYIMMSNTKASGNKEGSPKLNDFISKLSLDVSFEENFHLNNDVYQMWIIHHDDEKVISASKKDYDHINIYPWNTESFGHSFAGADVIPKKYNKATGIKKYLEHCDKKDIKIYAFGDGNNDLEMLDYANMGVAMGNATKELKKVANHITTNVDDDGIKNALIDLGIL